MKTLLDKLNVADINPGACTGVDGWIDDAGGERITTQPVPDPTRRPRPTLKKSRPVG